jgi:hypothetical protein
MFNPVDFFKKCEVLINEIFDEGDDKYACNRDKSRGRVSSVGIEEIGKLIRDEEKRIEELTQKPIPTKLAREIVDVAYKAICKSGKTHTRGLFRPHELGYTDEDIFFCFEGCVDICEPEVINASPEKAQQILRDTEIALALHQCMEKNFGILYPSERASKRNFEAVLQRLCKKFNSRENEMKCVGIMKHCFLDKEGKKILPEKGAWGVACVKHGNTIYIVCYNEPKIERGFAYDYFIDGKIQQTKKEDGIAQPDQSVGVHEMFLNAFRQFVYTHNESHSYYSDDQGNFFEKMFTPKDVLLDVERFVFCGVELGAGLAQLVSLYFSIQGFTTFDNSSTITFGCPSIGDVAFQTSFNSKTNHTCFTNNDYHLARVLNRTPSFEPVRATTHLLLSRDGETRRLGVDDVLDPSKALALYFGQFSVVSLCFWFPNYTIFGRQSNAYQERERIAREQAERERIAREQAEHERVEHERIAREQAKHAAPPPYEVGVAHEEPTARIPIFHTSQTNDECRKKGIELFKMSQKNRDNHLFFCSQYLCWFGKLLDNHVSWPNVDVKFEILIMKEVEKIDKVSKDLANCEVERVIDWFTNHPTATQNFLQDFTRAMSYVEKINKLNYVEQVTYTDEDLAFAVQLLSIDDKHAKLMSNIESMILLLIEYVKQTGDVDPLFTIAVLYNFGKRLKGGNVDNELRIWLAENRRNIEHWLE